MKLPEYILQKLKEKKISIKNLDDRYFIEFRRLVEMNNTLKLLNENICSLKEIIDKFKSIKDVKRFDSLLGISYETEALYKLLENEEFFEELIENNLLNKNDLEYLLNRIDREAEVEKLNRNITLLKYIVYNELFKKLVDKFKSVKRYNKPCLYELSWNNELFKELISNNKLTSEDLRYLLNTIDNTDELHALCCNISLIKKILNEFLLDTEIVDKFNTIIEKSRSGTHTIFDKIEYCNEYNDDILELNELNKKGYLLNNFDLTKDQKLKLSEVLKNNKQAQNTLTQIVDTHLEDQYDFETLKNLFTKDEEKTLKTKFNF